MGEKERYGGRGRKRKGRRGYLRGQEHNLIPPIAFKKGGEGEGRKEMWRKRGKMCERGGGGRGTKRRERRKCRGKGIEG